MELHIKAIEASDVPNMDIAGKSDPYLKFQLSTSSQTWKTKVKKNTNKPVWNEVFDLPITSSMSDQVTISLYDKDDISKDDLISTFVLDVKSLEVGKVNDSWYDFHPAKHVKKGGKVRLVLHLDKFGNEAFKAYI